MDPEKKNLTGFEDTGEQDNFGQILDFDTPETVEKKPDEEKKPGEEKKNDKKGKGPSAPPPDDLEGELKFFEGTGATGASGPADGLTGPTGPGSTGPIGPAEEEDDGIFKLPDEEQRAIENKEIEKKLQFNYSDLAQEIGIEDFKEGERTDFVNTIKKAIDDAKTKVEFDLSKLEDNEQELIKFFRNGGKVSDILNPTQKFDEFLQK